MSEERNAAYARGEIEREGDRRRRRFGIVNGDQDALERGRGGIGHGLHDENRQLGAAQDAVGGAAQEETLEPIDAARAHDDRIDAVLRGIVDDGAGRRTLEHDARHVEPGSLRGYFRPAQDSVRLIGERLHQRFRVGDAVRLGALRDGRRIVDGVAEHEFAAAAPGQSNGDLENALRRRRAVYGHEYSFQNDLLLDGLPRNVPVRNVPVRIVRFETLAILAYVQRGRGPSARNGTARPTTCSRSLN